MLVMRTVAIYIVISVVCVGVYIGEVCVCLCVREREREGGGKEREISGCVDCGLCVH